VTGGNPPEVNPPARHQTVLLHEAVESLEVKPDGVYVDGTFGRGGHSRAILERLGRVAVCWRWIAIRARWRWLAKLTIKD